MKKIHINEHKSYKGQSLILLLLLNIFDGLITYIGLEFGFYQEMNVLVNNIYNLLVSETKDIGLTGNDKEEFALLLENIKNMDSVEKVKNVVEEEGSYFLHIMSGFCLETISYISKRRFTVYAELLVYNMAYKVLFESYYELFRYLRKKIQSAIDNPLKDDVFLMITTG